MPAAASHLTAAGPLCLRPVPHRDTCEHAASGSAAHEAGNVWTLRRQLDFTPVPPCRAESAQRLAEPDGGALRFACVSGGRESRSEPCAKGRSSKSDSDERVPSYLTSDLNWVPGATSLTRCILA
jgi:hypothetical protein